MKYWNIPIGKSFDSFDIQITLVSVHLHNVWFLKSLLKATCIVLFANIVKRFLFSAFTESAIIITSCIYEADVKAAKEYSDGKKIGSKEERTSWNKIDIEFGDCINHSGRLLINHGLTTDAIVTENNTFLENETVQKILNKTWYGSERVNCQAVSRYYYVHKYTFI